MGAQNFITGNRKSIKVRSVQPDEGLRRVYEQEVSLTCVPLFEASTAGCCAMGPRGAPRENDCSYMVPDRHTFSMN